MLPVFPLILIINISGHIFMLQNAFRSYLFFLKHFVLIPKMILLDFAIHLFLLQPFYFFLIHNYTRNGDFFTILNELFTMTLKKLRLLHKTF